MIIISNLKNQFHPSTTLRIHIVKTNISSRNHIRINPPIGLSRNIYGKEHSPVLVKHKRKILNTNEVVRVIFFKSL